MALAALALSLLSFILSLKLLHAEEVGAGVLVTARKAGTAMTSAELDDAEKERLVRQAAGRMLAGFFRIGGIALVSAAIAAAIVWGGSALGLYTLQEAADLGASWPFLFGSTLAALALWVAMPRRRAASGRQAGHEAGRKTGREAADDVPYGGMDRALHRLAFAAPGLQKALARAETARFADRIDLATAARPVFVTSLARAGTTILLDVLAAQREFASATYRQMPFALAPLLWSELTRRHRKTAELTERAHGDGLEVGFDSPEAFEEMVWMAFWRDHYRADHIRAWSAAERNAAFEAFFPLYRAKIVATRPGAHRYLAKNNASIARLGLIERLCPDADIVIPVRDPVAHARSLLRQHQRFAALQAREPFARRYMEGIGHFEFGAALRPLRFAENAPVGHPDEIDFWLDYWIRSYEGVLATAGPAAILLDHDALSRAPHCHLPALAAALRLEDRQGLIDSAPRFRAPRTVAPPLGASAGLLSRAQALHGELLARCLAP